MMSECQEEKCSASQRYLLRLRSQDGSVYSELRLCPGHYKIASDLIDELAPGAERTISGYESQQSKEVH